MTRQLVILLAAVAAAFQSSAQAAPVSIAIDIDSTRINGTDTSGVITTQPGFVSWNLTNVATAGTTIVEQGTTFEIFGLAAANQSRYRTAGVGAGTDDLVQDFVFNDGSTRAIGLRISGLDVGTYAMSSYHYDSTVTTNDNFIQVEVRNQGDPSGAPTVDKFPFGSSPATFTFDITAVGQVKEIVFREDDAATATDPMDQNRSRLNGFTLTTIPEPSGLMLGAIALTTVASTRRRRR